MISEDSPLILGSDHEFVFNAALESTDNTISLRDSAKKPLHAAASVGTASLLMIADIVGVGVSFILLSLLICFNFRS